MKALYLALVTALFLSEKTSLQRTCEGLTDYYIN